jgi:hypothetical protein
MLERFLSSNDQGRAQRVIQKLASHDIRSWVLTGGLAVEIHHIRHGADSIRRSLIDIDFVSTSFDCIPKDLDKSFLFRHVHPLDPPGKTILQAIDVDEAVRVDVFHDGGVVSRRAEAVVLAESEMKIISMEDLLARMARLTLDIAYGEAVPAKHARDFFRLAALADLECAEKVWPYHRRENHPASFREVHKLLQDLVPKRKELLITPTYATEFEICKRCMPTPYFPLADPKRVYSILGYY